MVKHLRTQSKINPLKGSAVNSLSQGTTRGNMTMNGFPSTGLEHSVEFPLKFIAGRLSTCHT
jgi:hypothetical protein